MNGRIVALILLGLATIALWIFSQPPSPPDEKTTPTPPETSAPSRTPATPPPAPATAAPTSVIPPQVPVPPPAIPRASIKRDLANPLAPSTIPGVMPPAGADTDDATSIDFDKITAMLRDYRTLNGENPVGTNAEIMKSIMGGNPKGAMLGPPEGQSVNEVGELIDRWGTPYFFHQLSGDRMEIRSAGEDRRMWTGDDLVR